MATTKLWHIKGKLKVLIDYVENPEKTVPDDKSMQDFLNVFSYVQRSDKTDDGQFVTAINCMKETALQQMILTKKRYFKEDKYIAWHGYQSFKPDEVTPEQCHEIGVKLAKEMWGDRFQIIVTTHLDKEHLHNHFCFNSVSFIDGKKYNYSNSEIQRLRDTSDRICREYGLSVIQKQNKAPSRPTWIDEREGKATRYNVYRQDVSQALEDTKTSQRFEMYLRNRGYETDFTGEHWKVKLPQYEHFTNLETLNPEWTPDFIKANRGIYAHYGSASGRVVMKDLYTPDYTFKWTPHQMPKSIIGLFMFYLFKVQEPRTRRVSPYLKEDLRKLDEISNQVNYMSKKHIDTLEDLYADREALQSDMDRLIEHKTKLRNKIRRATPEQKEVLRAEKQIVTAHITEYRKQLNLNKGIEKRSIKMQQNLDMAYDNDINAMKQQQKGARAWER